MRLSSFITAMTLLSASLAVRADSFTFSFGDVSTALSGSGILTAGAPVAPGEYVVTGATGSASTVVSGPSIDISSLLAPGTFPTPANGGTFPANDNTIFISNGVGSATSNGLSFVLKDGTQINLYNPSGSADDAFVELPDGTVSFADVPVHITPLAPVPEPSSLGLLSLGFAGVAGAARRKFL